MRNKVVQTVLERTSVEESKCEKKKKHPMNLGNSNHYVDVSMKI